MDLALSEARRLARRWPAVEMPDIYQEILLWAVENGIDGSEIPADAPEDQIAADVRTDAIKALRYKLRDAGGQYCRQQERTRRREKAAASGYSVEDEAFYGLGQLRLLVEQYMTHGVTERPPVGRADSVRRTGDPAEGGTWMASLADVERGLKALPPNYRYRLWWRYAEHAEETDEEVAWQCGLTEGQVRGRVRTALQALQRELGGGNPWQRGPTPKPAGTPAATV